MREETLEPGEKPIQEHSRNSVHILPWPIKGLIWGYRSERLALSPLDHPCHPSCQKGHQNVVQDNSQHQGDGKRVRERPN